MLHLLKSVIGALVLVSGLVVQLLLHANQFSQMFQIYPNLSPMHGLMLNTLHPIHNGRATFQSNFNFL
jgi:hypothetical protein